MRSGFHPLDGAGRRRQFHDPPITGYRVQKQFRDSFVLSRSFIITGNLAGRSHHQAAASLWLATTFVAEKDRLLDGTPLRAASGQGVSPVQTMTGQHSWLYIPNRGGRKESKGVISARGPAEAPGTAKPAATLSLCRTLDMTAGQRYIRHPPSRFLVRGRRRTKNGPCGFVP